MKFTLVVIIMSMVTNAYVINYNSLSIVNGVYDYHRTIGIPLAEEIKKYESGISIQRITGGLETDIDAVPYLVGLIVSVFDNLSICGGSIISSTRVLTAAHCYFDGISTAQGITVVLGSNQLFFGGTRIDAADVVAHSGFNPITIENDIAVIRVSRVIFSSQIQPVALPSGEVNMDFTGYQAIASGYGMTSDGTFAGAHLSGMNSAGMAVVICPKMGCQLVTKISLEGMFACEPIREDEEISLIQTVSSVTVPVISNEECAAVYGGYILEQHLCTSGMGAKGTCGGDSGGPLVVDLDSRNVLIGITSFGAEFCTGSYPSAYVRVTEFLDWISIQMD